MTLFFARPGASSFEILSPSLTEENYVNLRAKVIKLLMVRDFDCAIKLLISIPFTLSEGTNHFGDEFHVLHAIVSIDRYVELAELDADSDVKSAFRQIANAFSEVGFYVRFIDISVSADKQEMVTQPTPKTNTQAVEIALRDSQLLLHSSGAASAVDRVHTALHGYLREICKHTNIQISSQASLTELFKAIRSNHSGFNNIKTESEETKRLMGALGTVVDSLNTLRNRASIAHPNETILEEAEAVLAINCGRTLLHYIASKILLG